MKVRVLAWLIVILAVTVVGGAAPEPVAPGVRPGMRFVAMDVMLDTGAQSLAAYQVELTAGDGVLVGVEGGSPAAFAEAPFYDPAALTQHRIVLAAFKVGGAEGLPRGNIRVARIHLEMTPAQADGGEDGSKIPTIDSKLIVATDAAGRSIRATLRVVPFRGGT